MKNILNICTSCCVHTNNKLFDGKVCCTEIGISFYYAYVQSMILKICATYTASVLKQVSYKLTKTKISMLVKCA